MKYSSAKNFWKRNIIIAAIIQKKKYFQEYYELKIRKFGF